MKNCYFFFLLTSLCCLPVQSDVQFLTSINDVYNRGPHELPGTITVEISSDLFATVTANQPYFLRLSLTDNSLLADTQVDLTSSDPAVNTPIYLAMELNSAIGPDRFMNAPAETISIVRWVGGEPHLWIRIQSSSSQWVGVPGQSAVPPSKGDLVRFEFGISARGSFEKDLQPLTSNLPYNTRNLDAQYGSSADSTSTLICVDLTSSSLSDTGIESLLEMEPIFFDATAEVSPGVFQAGNDVGIIILGDMHIARGRNRECQITPNLLMPSETVALGGGFFQTTAFLNLDVFCASGGTFLFTSVEKGSVFQFSLDPMGSLGFEANGLAFLDGTQGSATLDPASEFQSHGRTLYRTANLIWEDDSAFNPKVQILAKMIVAQTESPADVFLTARVNFANHDGPLDDPPFNLPHQNRRCQAGFFNVLEETIPARLYRLDSLSVVGDQLLIEGECPPPGVDVFVETGGVFVLLEAGLHVNGTTSLDLSNAPNALYGVAPAGETPDSANFVTARAVQVPTLGAIGLWLLIGATLMVALALRRKTNRHT